MPLTREEQFQKDFQCKLRAMRDRAGLSQSELSRASAIHPSQISHYETGVNHPTPYRLRCLLRALDATAKDVADLLGL